MSRETTAPAGDGFYGANATALAGALHSAPALVRVDPAALRALRARVTAAVPAEAGGALGGRRQGNLLVVTAFVPLDNRARSPRDRFLFDPIDALRAEAGLRHRGLALLGFAHSHPAGTCAPSGADHREAWRHHLHLIAAPDGGPGPARACPVRAWWCLDRGLVPVRSELGPEPV